MCFHIVDFCITFTVMVVINLRAHNTIVDGLVSKHLVLEKLYYIARKVNIRCSNMYEGSNSHYPKVIQ